MAATPLQTVPDSQKDKKWVEENVNSYQNLIFFEFKTIRSTYDNKCANQNLRRGIINPADFMKVIDTHRLGNQSFPTDLKHVGIGNSRITRLVGEHILRPFDFKAIVSSGDEMGVSRKENSKRDAIQQYMVEKLTQEIQDPQQLQAEIQKQAEYFKYDWQDTAEIGANIILNYYYQQQNLKEKFDSTFENFLVFGESIMRHQKIASAMAISIENPLRSFYISDSEATTEDGLEVYVNVQFLTPSTVQDRYWDKLSDTEVKRIQELRDYWNTIGNTPYPKIGSASTLAIVNEEAPTAQLLSPNDSEQFFFGSPVDQAGNVMVLYVLWKSKKQVLEIEYFDELGIQRTKFAHSKYKVDKNTETIKKKMWWSEWWQCTKIGSDIYVDYGPVDYLNSSTSNMSKQECPVTLQLHNFNNAKAQSLMDLIKPFDFWYDVYSDRRDKLVALLKPDILTYNPSMIPEGLDEGDYLYLIETTGTAPEDPTRSIPSGPAINKAAGNFNANGMRYLQSSGGATIRMVDEMMNSVLQQMDVVCGINSQRLGDVQPREAVANVQSANQNSSFITEKWFATHEFFKRRVMKKTLNIGKEILRENPQLLSWIMNDYTQAVMTDEQLRGVDMTDFDIMVTSSTHYEVVRQKIEMLFERAIASGTAKMSQLADLFMSNSLMSGIRKLKDNEQKQEQAQAQAQQAKNQLDKQMHDEKMALEYAKLRADVDKASIQSLGFEPDSSVDDIIKLRKQALEEQGHQETVKQNAKQNEQDQEALRLKEKEIEVKKIQAKKKTTS
jgi:hypothetical protein